MTTRETRTKGKLIEYDSLVNYVHGLAVLGEPQSNITQSLLRRGYSRDIVDCSVRGIIDVDESPWPRILFEIGEFAIVCFVLALLSGILVF